MSTQGTDDERQHALAAFKTKLLESREWEAKLKALRQEIKGLQKDFDHTEDNIKALQSVGQIIGEVLKQLDDERCKPGPIKESILELCLLPTYSHCQGVFRSQICCWLQIESRQGQAETRNQSCSGHDYTNYHAHVTSRS